MNDRRIRMEKYPAIIKNRNRADINHKIHFTRILKKIALAGICC